MKTLRVLTAVVALASFALVGCDTGAPTSGTSAPVNKTTKRTIEEFVAAQGTFCFDLGSGCFQFVPPLENFLGWTTSSPSARAASIDYAGIADRYIKAQTGNARTLGTTFSGSVTERELADGRVLVSVDLKTDNALAWAVESYDFAGGSLLVGVRAPQVLAGAAPVLGSSHLTVDFTLANSGDPLPDLLQILAFPTAGQEVRRITFEGKAKAADGTSLHVVQIGNWQASSHSPNWDGYPAESVTIK